MWKQKGLLLLLAVVAMTWPVTSHALDFDRISINGYFSFEFENQLGGSDSGDGDPYGSLDADMIDIVFNFQVSDRVRVATDLTWEHGTATEDDFGNAGVEYAFAEYTFTDAAKVRFGKQFTPFGYFNEIHTAKPVFLSVKEAASTNKPKRLIPGAKRFYPRWGSGIVVTGDAYLGNRDFDYHILIANGGQEDENPYEADENSRKSYTVRARYQLFESLLIGGSLYSDKTIENGGTEVLSYGGQLEWTPGQVSVLAEYVTGEIDRVEDADDKQSGWWIQPSYAFSNGITPYVRYESFKLDQGAGDNEAYSWIIGLNLDVAHGLIFKVEDNYINRSESVSGDFDAVDYHEIKAAAVVGW